jgi:hypothetical protein
MKSSHLEKIEGRRLRVLELLLPDEVPRGEVADPERRLRELIGRLGGRDVLGPEFPLRTAVANVRQLLEEDLPELMAAVREANNADPARCRYCGERYLPLLTVASRDDPDHPGGWLCRDSDGCDARIARAG